MGWHFQPLCRLEGARFGRRGAWAAGPPLGSTDEVGKGFEVCWCPYPSGDPFILVDLTYEWYPKTSTTRKRIPMLTESERIPATFQCQQCVCDSVRLKASTICGNANSTSIISGAVI